MLKIFVKKIVLLLQAITSGDLCKRSVLLKTLYVQFELEAKPLSLNKLLFTKLKRSKSSQQIADTKHVFLIWWSLKSFYNVLSFSLPLYDCLLHYWGMGGWGGSIN